MAMLAFLAAFQIMFLTACSVNIPMVSDSADTEGYTDAQTMLIIATERNRYRQVYTAQIWNVEVSEDKMPFQTYLLEQIRTFLGEVKSMNLLADEQGLTLTSQEREKLKQLADDYYNSLTDADKAYTKATRDDVYTMYEAYHRANKLVNELTKDVSLEISDSEAKVIQVQEIAVSNEAKAQELYAKVANEGADFAATARKESENPDIEVSVGRGERDAVYEEPVFALEAGEISEPFLWHGFSDASHYNWRDPLHLVIYATPGAEPADGTAGWELGVWTDRTHLYELVDTGFFKRDGHCNYSPDGRFLLYDSYADGQGYRDLYVYDLERKEGMTLGRYYSYPELPVDIRTDFHPRWSRDGKSISFDSNHEGFRGIYTMDLSTIVK